MSNHFHESEAPAGIVVNIHLRLPALFRFVPRNWKGIVARYVSGKKTARAFFFLFPLFFPCSSRTCPRPFPARNRHPIGRIYVSHYRCEASSQPRTSRRYPGIVRSKHPGVRANVEVPTKRGKDRGEVAEECKAKLERRRKEKHIGRKGDARGKKEGGRLSPVKRFTSISKLAV